MLTWLRAEFNGIDIDTVLDDVNLEVETSSDDSSDDSDIDKKPKKKKKKKVSFKVPTKKTVPAAPIIDPIESITKRLDELTISTQELLRMSNQALKDIP
ncbi:hypothetical protein Hypma_004744 [Hypsizygus marmoreus]|uniref:Uncharacterized protein n=1 Tax=Hypsizygus marmoreus TaxID=39966 RepID=A0A369J6A1_HYPMA|nr:hypothetical protein Hypma_004744 [Hypsizygus marmoreus]